MIIIITIINVLITMGVIGDKRLLCHWRHGSQGSPYNDTLFNEKWYLFFYIIININKFSVKSLNNFILSIRYIEKDMHYRHKQTYKIRAGVYVLTSNDSIIVYYSNSIVEL